MRDPRERSGFGPLFDEKKAVARRDSGIARAVEHADREEPDWYSNAFRLLQRFLERHEGDFLAEDVVAWADGRIVHPPDARAWGGVIRRAAIAGLIRKNGYAPANTSNRSPKCLWRSTT
jgi:hypothetical protein